MNRTLSPYEHNHLVRHGFKPHEITKYGEMPVEYITGHVDFCGHDFLITQDALIPRLETEELVALAVTQVKKIAQATSKPLAIADIGCGSGAIGLSILLELLSWSDLKTPVQVYLSEVSPSALKIAHLNLKHLLPDFKLQPSMAGQTSDLHHYSYVNDQGLSFDIFVITSDLLANFPEDTKFDLMVSNLPYIPTDRISSLESSVKDFEPTIALDGGAEGLTLIQTFLNQAPAFLKPGGQILLEVDYTHTAAELIANTSHFQAEVITDQFLRQRFGIITLK